MAYVEIWKNGRLLTRRTVNEEKARKGCKVRIGPGDEVRVAMGQSETLGPYEVRMVGGKPPEVQANTEEKASAERREVQARPTLEFSIGPPASNPSGTVTRPDIEGYKIIEPLGEGGMGMVWRAEQLSTKRQVALKVMAAPKFASQKAQARFEREVELTARLNHPNIARIYDSGLHHGIYYYAMELVDGVPLNQYVKSEDLSKNQILVLMQKVCQAVLYAHLRAVIHRDLKPSNILVTEDGQPHILDFGLAKALLEEDEALTLSIEGQIAGTPAYMSPEQATGRHEQTDTRTDVFSLGVILYELLTGQSPHDRSGSMMDLLHQITEGRVRRPREMENSIDSELEAILLKALALNPDDRYASAGALAKDITSYLDEEPLDARVPTTLYFLRKRVHKYRRQVLTAAICSTVLVGLGLYAFGKWVEQTTRLHELEIEARKGNLANENVKWTELELNILSDDKDEARASLRVMRDRFLHDQERINELIEGKVKIPRNVRSVNLKKGNPPSRMSLVQGPALPSDVHSWTLETIAHRGPVYQLAGSPDGRRFVSMSADETFRVWDTDTGRLESIFVPGPLLEDAVWSSDGQSLTVAQYHPRNTDISIWDTQMKELTRTESLGVVGTDFMKISPQAKFVAIHLADVNSMQIWDLTHRQIHHTLSGQDKPRAFDWSPNDRYYSILKPTGTLTVWDVSDNSRVYATGDPNQPVTAMAWIPQGDQLSFACNGHIDIVNMPTGSIAESIQLPPSRPVDDFAWSQTGRRFSFISEKHVSFMGRARGVLQTLHLPYITAQTWVGDYLVLSDSQGSLFCVDPSSCKIIQRWISNWCGPARQVRISPSENRVALLSANGMISLWDMYTWEPIYSKGAESVNSDDLQNAVLLWSPTGDELVCNDPSGSTLIFRDSYSLQTLRKLPIPETRVTCGARSEKGLLAVGTEKGDLYVSRWSQTKFVSHLQGHQGPVNAVVWIPSDQLLVSAGQDRTIRFWDVLTGQCTRMITDHGAPISDLALSPDQKTLASIDLNRQVLLWDASSGTQIQRLSDDMIDRPQWKGELTVTAWSPDGTMLAVAEQRGGIQIWKPQEKIVLRRRNTGGQCIHSIAWSPDNRYLLAGTTDGTTRIWDVLNDLRRHVLLLPLSGTAGPGIAVADEGDYRGPPGIQQYLRYVVDSRRGHQTLYANEFYNTRGWVNEPWQVGLFQPSKEEIKRLYVRAGAQVPCDGRTWETAFSDLQDALSRATDGTEIWVAQGTYRPDRGTGSRLASFVIRDGIRVYGGFRGDETNVHQRDSETNRTILSGDLIGNDQGLGNNGENSFHVVIVEHPRKKKGVPQGVLLDGFIIRGGNANEPREDTQEQRHNRDGGGVLVEGDRVTVQNCIFEYNAAFRTGGGLVLAGDENIVKDCRFTNNISQRNGGGLTLLANGSKVSCCVFERNRAAFGGGLDLGGHASLAVDCRFIMNQAENGGAVFGGQDDSVSLLFCTFYNNRAARCGGAWYQQYTRAMNAQNCLFVKNTADESGGAIHNHGYRGRAHLEGCGFIGNSAKYTGGALSYKDGIINAVNCSFVDNGISGDPRDQAIVGGIHQEVRDPNTESDTALILSNCILWGNTDHRHHGEQAQLQALNTQINNCCIQGWTGRLGGSENHGDDPMFIDLPGPDGILGTPDDDLRLSPESPCIDRGDIKFLGPDVVDMDQDKDVTEPIPFDLGKKPRILNGNVDVGAHESG